MVVCVCLHLPFLTSLLAFHPSPFPYSHSSSLVPISFLLPLSQSPCLTHCLSFSSPSHSHSLSSHSLTTAKLLQFPSHPSPFPLLYSFIPPPPLPIILSPFTLSLPANLAYLLSQTASLYIQGVGIPSECER